MSVGKLKRTESIGKISAMEERICQPKTTRSHERPPSATGIRSKIPKNVKNNRAFLSSKMDIMASELPPERPNSQGNPSRRPLSRSLNTVLPRTKSDALAMHRRSLENQLLSKKHKFTAQKRELDEKQKNIMEIIKEMSNLREKLIAAGGKDPGKIDQLKLLPEEVNPTESGEIISPAVSTTSEEIVLIFKQKLEEGSRSLYEIGNDTLIKYSEILKWLDSFYKGNREVDTEELKQLEDHENYKEKLRTRLESAKKLQDDLQVDLIGRVAILWSEVETSRLQTKQREAVDNEIDELQRKIHDQTEKMNQMKERKTSFDELLIRAELKIKELEEKNSDFERTMASLEAKLKEEKSLSERKSQSYDEKFKKYEKVINDLKSQLGQELSNENVITDEISEEMKKDKVEIELLRERIKILQKECATTISVESEEIKVKFQEKLDEKEKEVKELKSELQKVDRTHQMVDQAKRIKNLEKDLRDQNNIFRNQQRHLAYKDETIAALKDRLTHGNHKSAAKMQADIEALQLTLEQKEKQLSNLGRIVEQMAAQERSSQEQRTRLERRIAQLELKKNGKDNRYVSENINEKLTKNTVRFDCPKTKIRRSKTLTSLRPGLKISSKHLEPEIQDAQRMEDFYNWMMEPLDKFSGTIPLLTDEIELDVDFNHCDFNNEYGRESPGRRKYFEQFFSSKMPRNQGTSPKKKSKKYPSNEY